jgi:hypothetical protein
MNVIPNTGFIQQLFYNNSGETIFPATEMK